jgi:ATP-dependent protease HslVU (ClpYQ) ATPase subunit
VRGEKGAGAAWRIGERAGREVQVPDADWRGRKIMSADVLKKLIGMQLVNWDEKEKILTVKKGENLYHLVFDDSALDALSEAAWLGNENGEDIGARRLVTIFEKLLDDIFSRFCVGK